MGSLGGRNLWVDHPHNRSHGVLFCSIHWRLRSKPRPGAVKRGSHRATLFGGTTLSSSDFTCHVQRFCTRCSYCVRNSSAPRRLLMRRRAFLPAHDPRCLGGRRSIRLCVIERMVSSGNECSSVSDGVSDWTPGSRPPSAIEPAYIVSRCSLC